MYNLIALNKNHIQLVYFAFILIIIYALIYWYNRSNFKNLNTLLDGFYLSSTTFFSVGFGDILPNNNFAKILIMSNYLFMLLFILKA
jgi:hypothetical protein